MSARRGARPDRHHAGAGRPRGVPPRMNVVENLQSVRLHRSAGTVARSTRRSGTPLRGVLRLKERRRTSAAAMLSRRRAADARYLQGADPASPAVVDRRAVARPRAPVIVTQVARHGPADQRGRHRRGDRRAERHDRARPLVDRAYFMEKGEVRFDGPAADLIDRHDLLARGLPRRRRPGGGAESRRSRRRTWAAGGVGDVTGAARLAADILAGLWSGSGSCSTSVLPHAIQADEPGLRPASGRRPLPVVAVLGSDHQGRPTGCSPPVSS